MFKHVLIMEDYKIPEQTRIGHVHLKVSDLQKSLDFYCGLLGFDKMMLYGDQAAFISAGGYHHHIGLNTWHSKGAGTAPEYAPGLYHTAIL
jgi:catechol 2,3-dioxygenase